MPWYFWALLSVFALAGAELSQKIAMIQKENISAITNNFFLWLMQGLGGLTLAFFFGEVVLMTGVGNWLKLVVLALTYFLGGTFFYTSYKSNSPSISIILGSVSIIISTMLGIVIFQESTSIAKFVAILLILTSIVWINYKKTKIDKYNLFAFLGGICFGFAYTLDKSFAINMNPLLYVAYMSTSVGVLSLILKPNHIYTDAKRMSVSNFYPIIFAAFFGTLFNAFTFLAYSRGGSVGAVDAMNNSSIFLIILLEILILKDRSNLKKKIIASALVILGVVLLAIYSH